MTPSWKVNILFTQVSFLNAPSRLTTIYIGQVLHISNMIKYLDSSLESRCHVSCWYWAVVDWWWILIAQLFHNVSCILTQWKSTCWFIQWYLAYISYWPQTYIPAIQFGRYLRRPVYGARIFVLHILASQYVKHET